MRLAFPLTLLLSALALAACGFEDAQKVASAGGDADDVDASADSGVGEDDADDRDAFRDSSSPTEVGGSTQPEPLSDVDENGAVDADAGPPPRLRGCASWTGELQHRLTETIGNVPSCSTEEGDTDVAWHWVARPEGSVAWLLGPERTRVPMVLDLPGEYIIGLTAVDAAGQSISEEFTVTALPFGEPRGPQLTAVLIWHGLASDDPVATARDTFGPDMDLFFLNHALGCWDDEHAACGYRATWLQWPDGTDCMIDQDARGDLAAEYMAVTWRGDVEQPVYLSVGVGLYSDVGEGPVVGYLLLFDGGELIAAAETPPMAGAQRFATVAQIVISDAGVHATVIEGVTPIPEEDRSCDP